MLTPDQIADGWIEHVGGPCPVPLDSMVATLWGDGKMFPRRSAIGFTIWHENWEHEGGDPEYCIIAYKPEPTHDSR